MRLAFINPQGELTLTVEVSDDVPPEQWPMINYPGELVMAIPAEVEPDTHWWNGSTFAVRPFVPLPVRDTNDTRQYLWDAPPPGLHIQVLDTYVVPPLALLDADLAAPDCGILLDTPWLPYEFRLTADFPYRPTIMEHTP